MLFCVQGIFAQNKPKIYSETIEKFKRFYNSNEADSLFALYSAAIKKSSTLAQTKQQLLDLNKQLGKLKSVTIIEQSDKNTSYIGDFEKSKINIVTAVNDKNELNSLAFLAIREKIAEQEIVATKEISNYNIETKTGTTIYGTLLLPEKVKKNIPVVLFISGTGAVNRNGNSGYGAGTNAYKMLADSLQNAGIASLRYDKRGVGESSKAIKSDSALCFDDMVEDAVNFIKKIKKNKKLGNIYIVGHGEGALIAMIAANKEEVEGVVCIAAFGEPADVILKKHLTKNFEERADGLDYIISEIKAGRKIIIENKYLVNVFRPALQPYLGGLYAYNPQTEIKKIEVPILIIQGKKDLQVSNENAELLKKANENAELILLPDMNYVLKDVGDNRDENIASYNNPNIPVSAALAKQLIRFCK